MNERDAAQQVLAALKLAAEKPAPEALADLNGLVPLVQGHGEASLEVDEARASAFLAICEVGKALHRGQPADDLYAAAVGTAERWMALVR
jgi:hypothetical protein